MDFLLRNSILKGSGDAYNAKKKHLYRYRCPLERASALHAVPHLGLKTSEALRVGTDRPLWEHLLDSIHVSRNRPCCSSHSNTLALFGMIEVCLTGFSIGIP